MYWRLALFLLAVNGVLGFIAAINVNTLGDDSARVPFQIQPDNNWNITDNFDELEASSQSAGVINLGFGDVFGGLMAFINALARATIFLYVVLYEFGLPASLVAILYSLAWAVYGAGLIQLLSGRVIER